MYQNIKNVKKNLEQEQLFCEQEQSLLYNVLKSIPNGFMLDGLLHRQ
jgi:hypothetical protein